MAQAKTTAFCSTENSVKQRALVFPAPPNRDQSPLTSRGLLFLFLFFFQRALAFQHPPTLTTSKKKNSIGKTNL